MSYRISSYNMEIILKFTDIFEQVWFNRVCFKIPSQRLSIWLDIIDDILFLG